MFENRPVRPHFGLPPPPSNASVFTNSILSVHHVGLMPYSGGSAPPRRHDLSGRNSFFTTNRQALQNLKSNLAQPTTPSQPISSSIFGPGFTFSNQIDRPTPALSGHSSSIQALNNRLNPPLVNSNNNPPISQPSIFGKNLSVANTSAFPPNQPQTQATSGSDSKAPVQQTVPENNPSQPQNESASEEEEEEEDYEEEEPSENDPDSTTFAEDLQDLMASHQIMAPVDLFSNDTFTQNLVQFLKGFHIKVPRNKVLSRLPQEEPEAEINNQEKPVEKKEEPVQNRGIFQEIKTKVGTERLLPAKGKGFRSVKNKIKKHTYSVIPS